MNTGLFPDKKEGRFSGSLVVSLGFTVVMAICTSAPFLLSAADPNQKELPPSTLWEIVHNICVPGQTEHQNPSPCLQVDLTGGIEHGFAILSDPRSGNQFLLVPTTRISGIESPLVRGPDATNYFDRAWEARNYINEALRITLPRDDIGLAINSAKSRSQDQLHIHFSCIRPDVLEALEKDERRIGSNWVPLSVPLFGHHYIARWVAGEHLGPNNPFSFLAERLSGSIPDMANRTIVVIGFTRADGTKGFVILADRINEQIGNLANGEELLDHACHITTGSKTHTGLTKSGPIR